MKQPHLRRALAAAALAPALAGAAAHAQQPPLKIAAVVELSGTGATAGTNFRNGVELAAKEINAAGGLLGRRIELVAFDSQSNPGVAMAMAKKAADEDAFAIFGPVFSGSIMVSMAQARQAGIPNFVGGEATAITQQGNPFVFRTSFTQAHAMPKLARHIGGTAKVRKLALVYVNNDFGKGGLDAMKKALAGGPTEVVAEISTEPGQVDFSAAVLRLKQTQADAVFVYTNEEESARALRELRKQGWRHPVFGETTLTGQKVIELAGEAANGAIAHVGLTVDAPNPLIRDFRARFEREYRYVPDHNGIKGYTGLYILKAAAEKAGKADRQAVAQAMRNLSVSARQHPGVLMDVRFDDKGDLDRESFLVEVRNGRQEVVSTLPALAK